MTDKRLRGVRAAAALGAVSSLALTLAAAAPVRGQALPGYTPEGAAAERAREERVVRAIVPATLDSFSFALTREPHVAGSPAQARTRDWVLAQTRSWGLRSEARTYRVYLPWATSASLELQAPDRIEFRLSEEPYPQQDPTSALPQYPWVNGYSGVGQAEGQVVYVNYGLYEDYDLLDSMHVSVQGKIVLARYGRSYRGVKARLAERHGAAGLLIFSDPADDGYVRGDVYPDGPYRNPTAAQRGSILNIDGDPTTPGWASVPGARRIDPDSAGFGLAHIPVMPISYDVADDILKRMGPAELPRQEWQGGLPFRYHVGPGPAYARMRVEDDRAGPARGMKDIFDTFAWVPGSERPDEWVIVGGHRDAWNTGANDNVSGTAAVLAAAQAVAGLVRAGERPKRTIVFATWDAEEWGLMGSIEWVEDMARQLGAKAVAYLNQDAIADGSRFGASAAPALKAVIRDVTRVVPSPEGGSIYERWQAQAAKAPAAHGDVVLGNLGGGSDFAPFYNHLGIPSANWGFSGGSGEYHSAYDSYSFVSRFADPGFVHHAASAQLLAVTALRLADADVLPYDYAEAARELRAAATRLRGEAAAAPGPGTVEALAALDRLDATFRDMESAADSLAATRDSVLAAGAGRAGAGAGADAANLELLHVERSLLREGGLRGRPFTRNLTVAADYRNGYANMMLPGIAEALRNREIAEVAREADDLAGRVQAASGRIRAAMGKLGG